jgi:hypothetical protein
MDHPVSRSLVWRRLAPTLAAFALVAGCGASVAPSTGSAPTSDASATATSPTGVGVTALDGTITFTADGTSSAPGSRSESHEKLTAIVHLVAKDGGPGFADAGSTFVYSGTSTKTDDATASSCGMHAASKGAGSGAFGPPDGLIVGYYSSFSPDVSLGIHAPYTSTGTVTFDGAACKASSSTTTDGIANPSCGDPAGSSLVGHLGPGNVVDFTCSEAFAIGTGTFHVTGTLTAH